MEEFKFLGMIFLMSLLIVGMGFSIVAPLSYYSCKQKTADIGMESNWGLFSGCRVKHEGVWIPLDNYRAF